jgi:2-amino-4-hydroxy-6-hydroxymethyldihydropteridine diphosphokinase
VNKVYLALGSNVGDKKKNISRALSMLKHYAKNVRLASLYYSKAVGFTDQPDFLNTAVEAETNLTPSELLDAIKITESKIGRIARFRWGPREIDIDIIFYADKILNDQSLTIPHARYKDRDFVLLPLIELDSSLEDPVNNKKLVDMLGSLPPSSLSVYEKILSDRI